MSNAGQRITKRSRTSKHCAGVTSSGKPCRAFRVEGSSHCFFHSDELAAERHASQRKAGAVSNALRWGGLQDDMPGSLRSVEELMTLVEVVLRSCIRSDLDAKTANALGGLVRVQASLLVDLQFEKRLQALEEATKGKTDGPRVA